MALRGISYTGRAQNQQSCSSRTFAYGEVFTGYFGMDTMDKALIATNIQADATMDVVCANGQRIQQAWEDDAEDGEGCDRLRAFSWR